jgi:hypothetical protein
MNSETKIIIKFNKNKKKLTLTWTIFVIAFGHGRAAQKISAIAQSRSLLPEPS